MPDFTQRTSSRPPAMHRPMDGVWVSQCPLSSSALWHLHGLPLLEPETVCPSYCSTVPHHVTLEHPCDEMLMVVLLVSLAWWAWPVWWVMPAVMTPVAASGLLPGACVATGAARVHPAAGPPPQLACPLGRTPTWPSHPSCPISVSRPASSSP